VRASPLGFHPIVSRPGYVLYSFRAARGDYLCPHQPLPRPLTRCRASSVAPSPTSAKRLRGVTPRLIPREVGTITNVATGIARVSGLRSVGSEELLKFPGDVFGIAFNLDDDEIGVVLLGDYSALHAGEEVERTGCVMDVAVGEGVLGRVIDRSVDRLVTADPSGRISACPSNARPPPSWTAHR
jgi:flagellar biosynthesis/type III secretory pathway ATPase